jgi:hypothetical protein
MRWTGADVRWLVVRGMGGAGLKGGERWEKGGACRSMRAEWMDEMAILGGMPRIGDVAGTRRGRLAGWARDPKFRIVERESSKFIADSVLGHGRRIVFFFASSDATFILKNSKACF